MSTNPDLGRHTWVDVAKGICILLVVLMHSTLGVEKAAGVETPIHQFIEWARPFRMPDFFLISGLFLASRIDRPWREYLDSKVLHFAYFYVLWLTIQFAVKAPVMIADHGVEATLNDYLMGYLEPFGTLWFIYLLATYFIVTKLLKSVPKLIVFAVGAAMHVLIPETGHLLIDEFADRFVFFFTGYAAATTIFSFADKLKVTPAHFLAAGLTVWVVFNTVAVMMGFAFEPGLDLAISFIGIGAVIMLSVLLAVHSDIIGPALSYLGRNSIIVYLAFPLFMGPTRAVLLKLTGTDFLSFTALASASAGVIGALVLYHLVKPTFLSFLFVRPNAFRLTRKADKSERSREVAA